MIEGVEIVGDGAHAVEHALAAHLAGVGGDHRGDQRVAQQADHGVQADPLALQRADRPGQGIGPAVAAAPAPTLDLVLGDIGDLQEAGEGMGEAHGVGQAERAQPLGHQPGRLGRPLAVKRHRGLADVLDLAEHRLAVLGADHIAQHPAEEPDGGSKRIGRGGGHDDEKPQPGARVIWFPDAQPAIVRRRAM